MIEGVNAGDVIQMAGADTFLQTRITLSEGADGTLQAYADKAIADLDAGQMGWFVRAGNTYIVMDSGENGSTFDADSGDMIVMITGVLDLSTSSYNITSNTLELV